MKTNPWSMNTTLAVFGAVAVAVVLFVHVRDAEIAAKPERNTARAAEHVIRGASPADSASLAEIATPADRDSAGSGSGSERDDEANLETAVRASAAAFSELFEHGDAAAIAALWTVDGDYVDAEGDRFVGRQAIERQYERFFEEHPGARIRIKIDAIRPLGADTAIEDGHASLLPREPGAPVSSPYTVIHSKVDGRWLMASVREPAAQQADSNDPLGSLDWLVGTWQAQGPNGKMNVQFRWVAGHSFLERTYAVEQAGRITTSGVQLIGREVASDELRSWNFTSDAGYAVGSWTAQADGWAIVTSGKLPDGTTTHAVNYLTRLDDNTMSWQSRDRKAGETALPDTPAVRLTRIGDE